MYVDVNVDVGMGMGMGMDIFCTSLEDNTYVVLSVSIPKLRSFTRY
jgi:hypothetical protein